MSDAPQVLDVLEQHRFDEAKLGRYLLGNIPGFGRDLEIRQFQGGQSNPTFLLSAGGERYVLRKKPPGKLLPKAHQVEREFRIMHALKDSRIPLPGMVLLCEDVDVIGTAFFVMRFVPGRVISEPGLASVASSERRSVYRDLTTVLADLHAVDWRAAGLEGFGREQGYVARQLHTWTKQYEASKTEELPAMDNLIAWLGERLPADEKATIVHGDFRVGNTILEGRRPRIAALLDWELSTIGHPLADLGYLCMPYHLPAKVPGLRGLVGLDFDDLKLPDEAELVAGYADASGRTSIDDIDFFIAFALFRLAAIVQGIYARALQGNASDANALQVGQRAPLLARAGWDVATRSTTREI